MKDFDEFDLNKMLEHLPDLEPSSELKGRILSGSTKPRSKSFIISIRRPIAIGIAASTLMFCLGYFVSETRHFQQKEGQHFDIRQLLVQNLSNPDGPNQKLASIQYLMSTGKEEGLPQELIFLLQREENENVRLALVESLSEFIHLAEVQNQLSKHLLEEENPLVAISIINLLAKIKTQEGMQLLKEYQKFKSLDPLMEAYFKDLQL